MGETEKFSFPSIQILLHFANQYNYSGRGEIFLFLVNMHSKLFPQFVVFYSPFSMVYECGLGFFCQIDESLKIHLQFNFDAYSNLSNTTMKLDQLFLLCDYGYRKSETLQLNMHLTQEKCLNEKLLSFLFVYHRTHI